MENIMNPNLSALQSDPSPEELEQLISQEESDIGAASRAQDEIFNLVSPKGTFTPKGLSPLVDSLNLVLPLFSLPTIERLTEASDVIPDSVLRPFMMVVTAINDAVEDEVLPAEVAINIAGVATDSDLKMLAAKLASAAKSMPFRKYLKDKPAQSPVVEEVETKIAPAEMDDSAIEALFASRAR
jgi:hypothetical protein